jgi:hypothetical protein
MILIQPDGKVVQVGPSSMASDEYRRLGEWCAHLSRRLEAVESELAELRAPAEENGAGK